MAGWFIAFVLGCFFVGITMLAVTFTLWSKVVAAMGKLPKAELARMDWPPDLRWRRRDQWRIIHRGLPDHDALSAGDHRAAQWFRFVCILGSVIPIGLTALLAWPLFAFATVMALFGLAVSRGFAAPWERT